jgi:DNA-binding transcriptional MerR regulator
MDENDFLNISVFSDLTGISRSTLIYYDEAGVFSPAARGENNYRYYTPRQIISVNVVNVLRGLGIPLKEISRLAVDRTPQAMVDLFAGHEQSLEKQIGKLNESLKVLRTFRSLMESALKAEETRVAVVEMEALSLYVGEANEFAGDKQFYDTFSRYCKAAREQGVNLSYPVGGLFNGIDSFICKPSKPDHFFFFFFDGPDLKPAGSYIVAYTHGYYGITNDLPSRLIRYAESHSLEFIGPVYKIYILDEISNTDPNDYLLQVSAPVTKDVRPAGKLRG